MMTQPLMPSSLPSEVCCNIFEFLERADLRELSTLNKQFSIHARNIYRANLQEYVLNIGLPKLNNHFERLNQFYRDGILVLSEKEHIGISGQMDPYYCVKSYEYYVKYVNAQLLCLLRGVFDAFSSTSHAQIIDGVKQPPNEVQGELPSRVWHQTFDFMNISEIRQLFPLNKRVSGYAHSAYREKCIEKMFFCEGVKENLNRFFSEVRLLESAPKYNSMEHAYASLITMSSCVYMYRLGLFDWHNLAPEGIAKYADCIISRDELAKLLFIQLKQHSLCVIDADTQKAWRDDVIKFVKGFPIPIPALSEWK